MTPTFPRPKVTLRWFITGLSLAVLGMASLTQSSRALLSILATVTQVMFLLGLLGAILLRGPQRAFSIGFVLWGVSYLALVGVVLDKENDGMGRIVTTRVLKLAYSSICYEIPVQNPTPTTSTVGFQFPPLGPTYVPAHDIFMISGQIMWSWLFGLAGGLAAIWLQRAANSSPCTAETPND